MSIITGKWVGAIQGTNTGAVFVELVENEDFISGVAHINDPIFGLGVYIIDGKKLGNRVRLILIPDKNTRRNGHGAVTVLASKFNSTTFTGEWRSEIGTAGTLSMSRVDGSSPTDSKNITSTHLKSSSQMKSSADQEGSRQKRTKVFISYSHNDANWLTRLRIHLKPLERACSLDVWEDGKIETGSKWFDEIELAIQSAKIALLVISADFLASDFIAKNELPPLLDAAHKDGAVIMPLIAKPSRFRSIKSLSQFQAFNDPSRPLISLSEGEQEEILVKVSEDIEKVLGLSLDH